MSLSNYKITASPDDTKSSRVQYFTSEGENYSLSNQEQNNENESFIEIAEVGFFMKEFDESIQSNDLSKISSVLDLFISQLYESDGSSKLFSDESLNFLGSSPFLPDILHLFTNYNNSAEILMPGLLLCNRLFLECRPFLNCFIANNGVGLIIQFIVPNNSHEIIGLSIECLSTISENSASHDYFINFDFLQNIYRIVLSFQTQIDIDLMINSSELLCKIIGIIRERNLELPDFLYNCVLFFYQFIFNASNASEDVMKNIYLIQTKAIHSLLMLFDDQKFIKHFFPNIILCDIAKMKTQIFIKNLSNFNIPDVRNLLLLYRLVILCFDSQQFKEIKKPCINIMPWKIFILSLQSHNDEEVKEVLKLYESLFNFDESSIEEAHKLKTADYFKVLIDEARYDVKTYALIAVNAWIMKTTHDSDCDEFVNVDFINSLVIHLESAVREFKNLIISSLLTIQRLGYKNPDIVLFFENTDVFDLYEE